MSSLWRVRVLTVSGQTVALRLQMIHPDAGPFPSSREFAVRLLVDVLREGAELTEDVVESVGLSDERNVPFDPAAAQSDVEHAVRACGIGPEDDAWPDTFGTAWSQLWRDPDRVPTATITVRLSDPSWLRELTPGTEWDTAAYG